MNVDVKNDPNYEVHETELGTVIKHPAYATLSFARRSGNRGESLFGSNIKHNDTIACTIYTGELIRGLSEDWIHGTDKLIEVEMSYAQFAEAITSLNMGSGIPVTLRYMKGKKEIPPCDFIEKRQQFSNELKDKLKEINEKPNEIINNVTKLFQKKSLTKADKETILSELNKLHAAINGNIKFMYDQFNKSMEKTVTDAKGEIESFMQNKIAQIANTAISKNIDTDNPLKIEKKVEL